MSHPYAEATAHAALANLNEACELIASALRARTFGGQVTLMQRAQFLADNARCKLRDALTIEEMAVTTGAATEEEIDRAIAAKDDEEEAAE